MSLRIATVIGFAVAVTGCSTLSDQAPSEFQEAKKAIQEAQAADVDDGMPRAMEAAERKYDRAVDLLDKSGDLQSKGETSEADSTRKEAIAQAVAARDIARGGVRIVKDVGRYDANLGDFFTTENEAADAKRLTGENQALKEQNAALQAQVTDLTKNNSDLANKTPESVIPADFRVAKPVAYFAVGSTTLTPTARRDIEDLATLLKENVRLAVSLEGFADPRGSAERNRRLAESRVKAVADEVARQGVDPSRISQNAVGETEENVSGQNQGALQLDRKVVAIVTVIAH